MRSRLKSLYTRLFSNTSKGLEKFAMPREKVIVEFIGPPGVGKTTLKNAVLQHIQLHLHDKAEIKYLKNGVSDNRPFWQLLRQKLERVEALVSGERDRFRALDFFIREVKIESEMHRNPHHSYILDEGLCHNFNSELLSLTDDSFLRCIENRWIIYLRPENPKAIVERLIQRTQSTNQIVFYHQGKAPDELEKLTLQSCENLDRFIDRFKKLSSNLLILNADDSLENNRNASIGYIMKLA